MTAKTRRPCQCSTFTAYDIEGDVEFTTGCPGTLTARDFAPGHDAKLKGFLIRWARRGYEIRVGDVTRSAEQWADGFGFGYMVRAGIARPTQTPKVMKAEKAVLPVEAKVGRWTYEGLVMDGEFLYQDKGGESRRTDKFTLI